MARILVFGYGNPSRGDDALGPNLVAALESRFGADPELEFLTDFQLQIEHALDLKGCSLVLFADAHVSCAPPFEFQRLDGARDDSYTTHAMSPAAVLQVYARLNRENPPPTFLLSIRGHCFGLGDALSEAACDNLAAATDFCQTLLASPKLEVWESISSAGAAVLQPNSARPRAVVAAGQR
jgi:hydrogenase maturation protease